MSKEAMKLALEALEDLIPLCDPGFSICYDVNKAIAALRAALAEQPAQQESEHIVHSNGRYSPLLTRMMNERVKSNVKQVIELYDSPDQPAQPVAFEEWLANQHGDPEEVGFLQALRIAYISGQDSITTPPQRTWVGLTDEEVKHMLELFVVPPHHVDMVVQAIEAKLKEKNI